MKTSPASSFRAVAIAATLFVLPTLAIANDAASPDRANELLRATGRLAVQSAGPYVEVGTFQIQVSAKLGRASARLPDGTWLYENFVTENSAAKGTLVVRFTKGRVSEMALVTPALAAAMRAPRKSADESLVARRD